MGPQLIDGDWRVCVANTHMSLGSSLELFGSHAVLLVEMSQCLGVVTHCPEPSEPSSDFVLW